MVAAGLHEQPARVPGAGAIADQRELLGKADRDAR